MKLTKRCFTGVKVAQTQCLYKVKTKGKPPRAAVRAACREPKHGSGKKHSILSAATRVQVWPKSQRQRSWQPESSISDVEAVGGGQVNNLRNREFQGEMKVQKHLEIHGSAGLSLSEQPAEP